MQKSEKFAWQPLFWDRRVIFFVICPIVVVLLHHNSFAHSTPSILQNRCELKLVADYEFFKVIGNKNYANAARYLINLIERVNDIFSQVDWGLDINGNRLVNLGFTIKEMKIYNGYTTNNPTHFNYGLQMEMDAIDMLKSFSSEEGTNSTCLTVLVTAKPLQYGLLGVSNIGSPGVRGICAKPHRQNDTFLNTAIITVRRKTELMITRVVDLVLAHELGHSWGSLHDDPHDEECVPQNSRDGRYVMWESANTGYDKNNYNFSPCSIRSIHRVLYPTVSQCFVQEKGALCGNGILEEGEQCDSGSHLVGGQREDKCCTPKCTLKPGALCSPRHAECCSNECGFLEGGTLCQKENNDTCSAVSLCSDKCPEPKPLKDGTPCTDEGKCAAGECVSFCRSISPDFSPCLCEDASIACRRCCRSAKSGLCRPVGLEKWLPDNSMCIFGQCNKNVCEKKATDSDSFFWRFIDNFKGTAHPGKFLNDYIVFIVVITTLLFWCPCSALILYKDQQKRREMAEKRAIVAQNNIQIFGEPKRVATKRSISINNGHQNRRIQHTNSAVTLYKRNLNGRGEERETNLAEKMEAKQLFRDDTNENQVETEM